MTQDERNPKPVVGFAPMEERLAAIRRTQEEIASSTGTDIGPIVAKAIDAYWDEREKAAQEVDREVINDTIHLARAVAARLNPAREIVNDIVALVPATVTLLVAYLVLSNPRDLLFSPWKIILTFAATIITALFLTVLYLCSQGTTAKARWAIPTNSMGTLVGGLLIVAVAVGYGYWQSRNVLDLSRALALSQLKQLSLSSIETRQQTGKFLLYSAAEQPISVTTETISKEVAVYQANAAGLPGKLVAEITPEMGLLYWEYAKERKLQARFLFGTVEEVSADSFVVKAPEGKNIRIQYGSNISQPATGTRVVVALDPYTSTATTLAQIR